MGGSHGRILYQKTARSNLDYGQSLFPLRDSLAQEQALVWV